MLESPDNRVDAVRRLVEAADGKLETYYWMQGKFDGLAIAEAPTAMAANAVSLAVASSGAFSHVETHELIDSADIVPLLARAKELRSQFRPPGKTPAR
jgi:uncharacterized protein with GYD domain